MPTSGPVAATKKENNVAPMQQLVTSTGKNVSSAINIFLPNQKSQRIDLSSSETEPSSLSTITEHIYITYHMSNTAT